jgi:hypothetical protein
MQDYVAMSNRRALFAQEKALLTALLQSKPATRRLVDSLDDLVVEEMNDGGMGSLLLLPKGVIDVGRSFGQRLVEGAFTDADGVPVSVAVNVDTEGRLYELDMWKVNFARLLSLPDPSHLRITG